MNIFTERNKKYYRFFLLILFVSCSSSKFNSNMTPDERFEAAKKYMEKGDYLRAKTQFQILVMNYPGTKIADKSQFYFAESHFYSKEYILAAAEYEKMIRNYPSSEFVDDAQYKLGMCYYELSPNYALDQKYTFSAINEFQKFLEEYPASDLKPEVEKKLTECRTKLAKKDFRNGETYRKLAYYEAAIVYYDEVLQNYYDTLYAENALYWKGTCLMKLEKWQEAEQVFQIFMAKFPQSRFAGSVKDELRMIQKKNSG